MQYVVGQADRVELRTAPPDIRPEFPEGRVQVNDERFHSESPRIQVMNYYRDGGDWSDVNDTNLQARFAEMLNALDKPRSAVLTLDRAEENLPPADERSQGLVLIMLAIPMIVLALWIVRTQEKL